MNTIDAVKELETLVSKLVVFDSGGLAFVNPGVWQKIEQLGGCNCATLCNAYRQAQVHRMSEVDKLRLMTSYLLLNIMHNEALLVRLVETGQITATDLRQWLIQVDAQKGREPLI